MLSELYINLFKDFNSFYVKLGKALGIFSPNFLKKLKNSALILSILSYNESFLPFLIR